MGALVIGRDPGTAIVMEHAGAVIRVELVDGGRNGSRFAITAPEACECGEKSLPRRYKGEPCPP
jgi:hypothetical protein